MRDLDSALAEHLASGVTTLCTCWRIIRRDGVTLGFTDHDRALSFQGASFQSANGLGGSAAQSNLGLAVGGSEVAGVLTSDEISEEDLAAGLYDGARVEVWRVNWADTAQRVLLDAHEIGEVTRAATAFTAELRALSHVFDQERGRLYQRRCSAVLGDARCKVDLASGGHAALAVVNAQESATVLTLNAFPFSAGLYDGGTLELVGGAHAGLKRMMQSCRASGGAVRVTLWDSLPFEVLAGSSVRLVAGCDGAFATCRDRFANQANFRGFPHIPGNEVLLANAAFTSQRMDGGSLFR